MKQNGYSNEAKYHADFLTGVLFLILALGMARAEFAPLE